MKAFILAKNEESNIAKCIVSLLEQGIDPIVLDSGSTDATIKICEKLKAEVRNITYTNHADIYNKLTLEEDGSFYILDADMEITSQLHLEVIELSKTASIVSAPISMYWDGEPLPYGSLCPPKAIFYKSGKKYFEAVGHTEKLIDGVTVLQAKALLHHNDLKPYSKYIETQVRYAEIFIKRSKDKQLSRMDKLRINTPILIFSVPFFSLFFRMGILSGKTGIKYALDRLIAEAIMFRYGLSRKSKN